MTTRMTVAVSVLSLGLAVAALAGIPAFIENRTVGDVAALVGFATAIVGTALLLSAIPGQLKQNNELKEGRAAIKRNAEIDVDQLRIVRRRLLGRKADLLVELATAREGRKSWRDIGATVRAQEFEARIKKLEVDNADLDAEIDTNANEFRRLGVEPDAS